MSERLERGRRRPLSEDTDVSIKDKVKDEALQPSAKVIKTEEDPPKASTSAQAYAVETHSTDTRISTKLLSNRYEVIQTRPADLKTKQGTLGIPIQLQTNYFRVKAKPTCRFYHYEVSFDHDVELLKFRCAIISQLSSELGGYLYNGKSIFITKNLKEDKVSFTVTSKNNDKCTVLFTFIDVIDLKEWQSMQILNLILRRSVKKLKLQQVGRNFFDPDTMIDMRPHQLQLWPGFQTSIRNHERNILFCVELKHKVMRTATLYDIFQHCHKNTEEFRKTVLGMVVLTDYNNKTYSINDIDFAQTPEQTFQYKGQEISFMKYYKQRYNLQIKDAKQPLLLSKSRDDDIIILIPELCRATGLTTNMQNNFQLMRSMADHTRLTPTRRIERLYQFNKRLQQNEDSAKVLSDWNLALDTDLLKLNGRQLDPQRIVFRNNIKISAGESADWTRAFRENHLFTMPSQGLNNWCTISLNRNARELLAFLDALILTGNEMGMNIRRPREITVYEDRNNAYVQAMEECSRLDPKIILCLVSNNNPDRYTIIKKKGCLEYAIPTQVVTLRTAGNQRNIMTVAKKVAIQMNCKLGYSPWSIDIPLSGLMTVGVDVSKSSRDKKKAFAALVATMDMKVNSTFYSTVTECNAYDVGNNNVWIMLAKALRQYQREHDNQLPTRIIFYRDGYGDSFIKQLMQHEVREICSKLKHEYKRYNAPKPPMFAYILVSKSINTRLFAKNRNPPAGTIVDDIITLPERYDFFLVSQNIRQGTVSPTCYNILYSNVNLSPDQIQLLTYKMTHLYFNWSGTTRVPAVCQYSKKLSTLVATNLHHIPKRALEKKLYYL